MIIVWATGWLRTRAVLTLDDHRFLDAVETGMIEAANAPGRSGLRR